MSKLLQLVAACVCAVALASCGGSSEVSAARYVKSVCTAAQGWKSAIVGAGAKLQSAVTSSSLTQTKSDYVAFVGALVNATGRATDQLSAAGTPSVSGGQSISSRVLSVFSNAKGSLSRAQSEARAIPTNDKSAFNAATNKVQTDVRNSLAQMSSVTPANNAALRSAAANDPTCKRLASGG